MRPGSAKESYEEGRNRGYRGPSPNQRFGGLLLTDYRDASRIQLTPGWNKEGI